MEQEEQDYGQLIEILEEHRAKCVQEGKFLEAEQAKQKIEELYDQEQNKAKEQLKNKQMEHRLQIEDEHLNEFNKFNDEWDKRMMNYQEEAEKLEQQMLAKHQQKLQDFQQNLKAPPSEFKPSSEYLNLQRTQGVLVKRKEYAEAHKVKVKAESILERDQKNFEQRKQNKISAQESKLLKENENELKSLHKRIQAGLNQLKKQRATELEKLLQHYQNVKKQLIQGQKNEENKLEKEVKLAKNSSRYLLSSQSIQPTPRTKAQQQQQQGQEQQFQQEEIKQNEEEEPQEFDQPQE